MFSLKMCALTLVLVTVQANIKTAKNDLTKSPSSSKELPLQVTDVQPDAEENESKSQAVTSLPLMKEKKNEKLHSLSKRFIPSRSLYGWASPKRQSFIFQDTDLGNQRPISSNLQQPTVDDTFGNNRRVRNSGIIDTVYDPDFLDYVRELTISKRFLELLPAKVPRRKDLPPRLGEETAPKFVRAFSPASYMKPGLPPVREIFNDFPSSNHAGDPLIGNRFWSQTFHIDNPIINNLLDVNWQQSDYEDEFYSTDDYSMMEITSDYSDGEEDGSENIGEEAEDELGEESQATNDERTLSHNQQRDIPIVSKQFKEHLIQLLHGLRNSRDPL